MFIFLLFYSSFSVAFRCAVLSKLHSELTDSSEIAGYSLADFSNDRMFLGMGNVDFFPDGTFANTRGNRVGVLSETESNAAFDRAAADGVILIQNGENRFGIRHDGTPVISYASDADPAEVTRLFARHEHWRELVSEYEKQGDPASAARIMAMAALQTPKGRVSAESYAESIVLRWMDAHDKSYSPSGKRDLRHWETLITELNRPTSEALVRIREHITRARKGSVSPRGDEEDTVKDLEKEREYLVRTLILNNRMYRHWLKEEASTDSELRRNVPANHWLVAQTDPPIESLFPKAALKDTDVEDLPSVDELYIGFITASENVPASVLSH